MTLVFLGMVQSGMIEGGTETSFHEVFGNLTGTTTTPHIDNGSPWVELEQVYQFFGLVVRLADQISQVLALERHAEDMERRLFLFIAGF